MSPKNRRTLATYGAKGATVRVLVHDADTVRVEWWAGPAGAKRRRTKAWPNTAAGRAEAKEWAKGLAEERVRPTEPQALTLRELWGKYLDDVTPQLRARSQVLYAEYWGYWERMWGKDFAADETTFEMMTQFRKALRSRGLAVSTIGESIRCVKRVYRWGHTHRFLQHNAVADYEYRVGKDERTKSPPEYSDNEFTKILAALDPADGRRWRAHVALAICGYQGARQRAVLHLRWDDINERAARVHWRMTWDKMGKDWEQPLRAGTLAALEVAREWRRRLGYTGPWVIPSGSSKNQGDAPYSQQSLWATLQTAERRAGVPKRTRRGAHGLRKLLSGDVAHATKDPVLAMHAIGDTDMRQATRYIQVRDELLADAFAQLDAPRSAPESGETHHHSTVTEPETATDDPDGRPLEVTQSQGDTNAPR